MSAFSNILGMLGEAGNSAGIQGSGPGALNMLQRMALPVEEQEAYRKQSALANLVKDPSFQKMTVPQQQIKMAGITGDVGQAAAAGQGTDLGNMDFSSPSLVSDTIRSGNPMRMEALKSVMPLLQSQSVNNYANNGPSQSPSVQASPSSGQKPQPWQPPTQKKVGSTEPLGFIDAYTTSESGNDPNVVGDGGKAVGVAQAHPEMAAEMGLKDRTDVNASRNAALGYAAKYGFGKPNPQLWGAVALKVGGTFAKNWDGDLAKLPSGKLAQVQRMDSLMGGRLLGQPQTPQNAPPSASPPASPASTAQPVQPQSGASLTPPSSPDQQPRYPGEPQLSQDYYRKARKADALTGIMGVNGDQARAAVQDKESDPSYIAWKEATTQHYASQARMGEERNKAGITYQNTLNDNAAHAVGQQRNLAKLMDYAGQAQTGKLANVDAWLASARLAADPDGTAGLAQPDDAKTAAALTGIDKINARMAGESIREWNNRGGNKIEFQNYLTNNPSSMMTPVGFKNIVHFMQNSEQQNIDKQHEFTLWKKDKDASNFSDFDDEWNQKQMKNMPNTIAPLEKDLPQNSSPIAKPPSYEALLAARAKRVKVK